ncbi:MAG: GerMN domain-containing protein [Candidatus Nealsonbacteria bacterium]
MFKKIILFILIIVAVVGLGYWFYQSSKTEQSSQEESMIVKAYFGNIEFNPNMEDCSKVYPVERAVPKSLGVAKAALQELFKGPTEQELNQGYVSWFSEKTEDILISVKVENDTAYLNIKDVRQIIPNAGTSCGSAQFLAEVKTTLKQFSTVSKVIFAIEGIPFNFYEWIQIGCSEDNDYCNEVPFQTSED